MRVVAGQHQGFDPQRVQLADRFAAGLLDRVGHGEQGHGTCAVDQQNHRFALFFQRKELLFKGGRAQAQLFDQAVVTQVVNLAVDVATHTAPRQRREVIHSAQRQVFILSGIGHGHRHRVIRARSQACGQQHSAFGVQRVERQIVGLHRLAVGDGAGFIQRQKVQLVAAFEVHTAFDQDAFARSGRQTADDGYRGRDHQRARARHHQQHQRTVDPVEPRLAHKQRRDNRHSQSQQEHHRGVDFGEAVNKALGRCTGALGLFHRKDDARQSRIVGRCGNAKLQRTGLVDGARKDFVAHGFFHRQAFTGNRRLIDT